MIKFLDLKKITEKNLKEIEKSVSDVISSGWYLQGEVNKRFEKNYASYIGVEYAVGCANGLDALVLIYRAYIELGLMKAGDEVIVPANTYIASILAITENELVPVFVEPNIRTLEMDDSKIEAAITEKTKSILVVHLYGRCAYSDKIGEICKRYSLRLVEDNAQAHGCMFKAQLTGSLGDAAGHSFYPGKNLGAFGDAGAVTTNNKVLAEVVHDIANYGSQKKYVFKYCGRNSRLDEIQAAILNVKLKYLDEDNEKRRKIAQYYYDNLRNSLISYPVKLPYESNVFHIFPILTTRRNDLQFYLNVQGIQTLIHYPIPPHKQECYKEWNNRSYPVSEQIHEQELSLPISPVMSAEEAEFIVDAINNFK